MCLCSGVWYGVARRSYRVAWRENRESSSNASTKPSPAEIKSPLEPHCLPSTGRLNNRIPTQRPHTPSPKARESPAAPSNWLPAATELETSSEQRMARGAEVTSHTARERAEEAGSCLGAPGLGAVCCREPGGTSAVCLEMGGGWGPGWVGRRMECEGDGRWRLGCSGLGHDRYGGPPRAGVGRRWARRWAAE